VERQCGTEVVRLEAGTYTVVPTSSGIKLRQAMGKKEHKQWVPLCELDDKGEKVFAECVLDAYSDLFDRMDHDNDGFLCATELDHFMLRTEGHTVTQAAFQYLLREFDGRGVDTEPETQTESAYT